ncbi:MAG: tetratricopeptide repeat protein [Rhizobiaceae bacterium]
MADIFVSYTSSDRDWAFWIGRELKALGHVAHIHEWEIAGGENIYAWMEERHDAADHVLCVVSDAYLKAPYSTLERNAALWQAASNRPGFVLFAVVKPCRLPTLSDHLKRCELHGIPEDDARKRFHAFMEKRAEAQAAFFPGTYAVSNIPIRLPEHFLGRDDDIKEIRAALTRYEGRVAICALHGLRGVGKTTLAAAYAERHREEYRATWWVRAADDATMRADLVGLGVRLKWVAADDKEEPALATIMERLRQEGEGILLVYDNAVDAKSLRKCLPLGGGAHVLVTSNAPSWRGVASPVEIRLWPTDIGAEYLVVRTGRPEERPQALELSETLGGLPLAHEQAAAYCERLDIGLGEYFKRFRASPAKYLDAAGDAPAEYHDGLTVAKTYALAIGEAAKLHPAAEPLILHAALLAPEPIPLSLFSGAREKLGEPLASALDGDGLDEAVAALRAFALVDRERIPDERDPEIETDCIRLHRLVRQIAAGRLGEAQRAGALRSLSEAVAEAYPAQALVDPEAWPTARRLDHIAAELVETVLPSLPPSDHVWRLYSALAGYRKAALGRYPEAKTLYEKALAAVTALNGPEHVDTSGVLHNIGYLLEFMNDDSGARDHYAKALTIRERLLGEDDPRVSNSLNNLARMKRDLGEFDEAKPLIERALAIREKLNGPESLEAVVSIHDLAYLHYLRKEYDAARALYDRSIEICERVHGKEHFATGYVLNSYAHLLRDTADYDGAEKAYRRAAAIDALRYGPEHPSTNHARASLARLMFIKGDAAAALAEAEAALAMLEKSLGASHDWPKRAASVLAASLDMLGRADEAAAARAKYGVENFQV